MNIQHVVHVVYVKKTKQNKTKKKNFDVILIIDEKHL